MTDSDQHWQKSRHIAERIVIQGELELITPAHFGSGDDGVTADLTLLRDAYAGVALLPGASIAGALRSYWRERMYGYDAPARDSELFGAHRGQRDEMDGEQSLLIVQDAIGDPPQVELRDGVKIDGATRTAAKDHLFDVELLQAGTRFPLCFELLITEKPGIGETWPAYEALPRETRAARLKERRDLLCADLALAFQGFEREEIALGARKRRGFGRCRVKEWHVRCYDLTNSKELFMWLAQGRSGEGWAEDVGEANGATLAEKLGVTLNEAIDQRDRFAMEAEFALEGSLLIRSGAGASDVGPDAVHLHALYYDREQDRFNLQPIVPGTSLAGVLRARALRIANTLTPDRVKAQALVNALFGLGPQDDGKNKKENRASKLIVQETVVRNVKPLVQNRIRIDRFTGGAMDNYLFGEAPVFEQVDSRLKINIVVRKPEKAEIGLLLLLLKDLWTGDLPIGGESSVGRGRLRGKSATLRRSQPGQPTQWTIEEAKGGLNVQRDGRADGAEESLQEFVTALSDEWARR